jgi:copper chaperone
MNMTTAMQIEIDNLKCGGCEKSILKGLATMKEVTDVVIDREHQLVQFTGNEHSRQKVAEKLSSMGYPERGSLSAINAGLANAKSFVSCAIGRVS